MLDNFAPIDPAFGLTPAFHLPESYTAPFTAVTAGPLMISLTCLFVFPAKSE